MNLAKYNQEKHTPLEDVPKQENILFSYGDSSKRVCFFMRNRHGKYVKHAFFLLYFLWYSIEKNFAEKKG